MNTKSTSISIGDIQIAVTRKNIKNLHLAVYPPNGHVTISSPENVSDETVRLFFLKRVRDEKRFPNIDALSRQIEMDLKEARRHFGFAEPEIQPEYSDHRENPCAPS